ncbi:hypothetical protein ACN20G_20915 [Streptomyces sp. BI20]|uniref:hypothetical protein n=1 Tax=Streptomyces sp. BI20 TaxID=3403460 RepID=UPI003C74E0D1
MIGGREGSRRSLAALPAGRAESGCGRAWALALPADPDPGVDGAADPAAGVRIEAVTLTPGLVMASARDGERPRPYRTELRLPVLSPERWRELIADPVWTAAAEPALASGLVSAQTAGPLLPAPGEVLGRCSCPAGRHPGCPHAVALGRGVGRLLDREPGVLWLLRGRDPETFATEVARARARRAVAAADPVAEAGPEAGRGVGGSRVAAVELPGVSAREAVHGAGPLGPLPAPLGPAVPGPPPGFPTEPGAPDPAALEQLVADAVERARALAAGEGDPFAGLDRWQDAVRLAALHPTGGLTGAGRSLYRRLASAEGRSVEDLGRAAAAWRQGGPAALAAAEEEWDPPAGPFDRARPALLAAGQGVFRPERNRLTAPAGHRQLRLGRDGLWYAYLRVDASGGASGSGEVWWPIGRPGPDPVEVARGD